MTASVEDATILVNALHIDAELFLQEVDFLIHRQWGCTRIVEIITDFLEYPRSAEGGSANHHGIHAIAIEGKLGFLRSGDVTIADDRDVDARIVLHLSDEAPVCLARVHLASGSAMDGKGLDATILQLLG